MTREKHSRHWMCVGSTAVKCCRKSQNDISSIILNNDGHEHQLLQNALNVRNARCPPQSLQRQVLQNTNSRWQSLEYCLQNVR
jgi:hypothetical protein